MIALGHMSYWAHLLLYTMPIVGMQLGLLVWRFRARTPQVLRAILPPALVVSTWLSLSDNLAIRAGIWQFDPAQISGVYVGFVPVEEVAFFLLTSLLVAFGGTLLSSLFQSRERQ